MTSGVAFRRVDVPRLRRALVAARRWYAYRRRQRQMRRVRTDFPSPFAGDRWDTTW